MCSVSLQTKRTGYYFPLYEYSENNGQQTIETSTVRKPNLKIIDEISRKSVCLPTKR
jgi:hypothetical protein